jgi:hypothetical protein
MVSRRKSKYSIAYFYLLGAGSDLHIVTITIDDLKHLDIYRFR